MKYFLVFIGMLGFKNIGQTNAQIQFEEIKAAHRKRIADRLNELKNKKKIVNFGEQTKDTSGFHLNLLDYVTVRC